MNFYLGTHRPNWLKETAVPLFVSRRTLSRYRKMPRAIGSWALDSGGFTELNMHGRWTLSACAYADEVRRYRDEVGGMDWAAPQDWMCEPFVTAKTGLTVAEHQRRTIDNFIELRALAPDLPIVPVLQGWQASDYLEHIAAYAAAGVELAKESLVGLGTVCRRQATAAAMRIVHTVVTAVPAIRIHGFGFKVQGLALLGGHLASADSLSWSFQARRNPGIDGHEALHRNCANCITYALEWRGRLIERLAAATAQRRHTGSEGNR